MKKIIISQLSKSAYSGQIVKPEITNKSLSAGVSVEKTGPKEAASGQPVRYVFSNIGNTGNVMLRSFYWRDTLPAAVRLDKVVTGTYNISKRAEKEETAVNSSPPFVRLLMRKDVSGQRLFRLRPPSLGYCLLNDEPDTGAWQSRI